ncbi:MAG: calcium/sodium antiporter [Candidatus Komeilibacteria bacterium]|nr:calcium/sodium antiporter [Candidatus Komeilibacteria bacterium]
MLTYILFVVGLALLIKGADWLVKGSSSLAHKLNIPNIIIGLTIVSFGTSLPELIVSIFASLAGTTDVGLGTIVGSNISNIALILGATALIFPLSVRKSTTWQEIPFSILAILILWFTVSDNFFNDTTRSIISRTDGIIYLIFFGLFVAYMIFVFLKHKKLKLEEEIISVHSPLMISGLIIVGLAALYFGGQWVVNGAVEIARYFGLSEFVISATIIAVGTSLPELVTSLVAAFRKNLDLAVGNIVGSNIFNIFLILGLSSVIQPITATALISLDLAYLMGLSLILFAFLFIGKRYELDRWQGAVFLLIYGGYITFLLIR